MQTAKYKFLLISLSMHVMIGDGA